MKRVFLKTAAIVLCLVMAVSMLGGCGKSEEPDMNALVDAAVKAALDAAVVPTNITIAADGQQITVEDAGSMSLQQLLDQAGITLNEGDFLTVAPHQALSGNITVQVVRAYHVSVVEAAENPIDDIHHAIVLFEGTVADAIAAAGLELTENQTVNFELDAALEDGMEIVILTEKVEEETEPETEETEPATSASDNSSGGSSGGGSSTTKPTTKPTEPKPTTKPTEPKPTEPAPTEPEPTTPSRTVVSVEVYEDCDGSGHGVKVITYSDGTQEEVPF